MDDDKEDVPAAASAWPCARFFVVTLLAGIGLGFLAGMYATQPLKLFTSSEDNDGAGLFLLTGSRADADRGVGGRGPRVGATVAAPRKKPAGVALQRKHRIQRSKAHQRLVAHNSAHRHQVAHHRVEKDTQQRKETADEGKACHGYKIIPPSILGVGFGHSGTTTLDAYLGLHPNLSHGRQKEHQYMCSAHGFWGRKTWKHYMGEFNVPCKNIVRTYDLTPAYHWIINPLYPTACKPKFRGRKGLHLMKQYYPRNVQLIFTIRDPVDWINSKFHIRAHNWEQLHRYGKTSCYVEHMLPFTEVFGKENVLAVDFAALTSHTQREMDRVCKWLNVPPLPDSAFQTKEYNAGRRRSSNTFSLSGLQKAAGESHW